MAAKNFDKNGTLRPVAPMKCLTGLNSFFPIKNQPQIRMNMSSKNEPELPDKTTNLINSDKDSEPFELLRKFELDPFIKYE
jgi:hypothetical protein